MLRRLAPLLAAALLAAGLAACPSSKAQTPPPSCPFTGPVSDGAPLPACTFEGMHGWPALNLSTLKGTPVMINFWASWCSSCVVEMPSIDRVATAFKGRLTVIGMDVNRINGETRTDAEHFAEKTGVHYRLALDTGGALFDRFFGRTILPISVFVDARGVVAGRYIGQMDATLLRANLKKFLHIT